jgi:3-phenylpropionate/cinnamic acid dioxygenase small subunit
MIRHHLRFDMASTSTVSSGGPGAVTRGPAVDYRIQHDVEQFLYLEAEILDDRRLDDWLALLASDVHYFMPIRRTVGALSGAKEWSGADELAYFDEDKASLAMRVAKIQSGMAWAEEPPSRTRHIVTNVRVQEAQSIGDYTVKSAFLCYRNRLERQTEILVGERHDVLRRVDGGGFEIARRTIFVDQATLLGVNISFFL